MASEQEVGWLRDALEVLALDRDKQMTWAMANHEPTEEIGLILLDRIAVSLANLERDGTLSGEQVAAVRGLEAALVAAIPELWTRDGGITDAPVWLDLRLAAKRILASLP